MTGNYQGVNTVVLVLAATGYIAHRTGLDIKLYEAGRKKYQELRAKWRNRAGQNRRPTRFNII